MVSLPMTPGGPGITLKKDEPMSLLWDDDEEEELTEIEYRRRLRPRKTADRVLVHDEITTPMEEPYRVPSVPTLPQGLPAKRPEDRASPRSPGETQRNPMGLRPAPPRDRFVAFFIDTYLGLYLYWLTGALLAGFFKTSSIPELQANVGRLGIHLGITALAFFFYYLLMESVFHATLGKLFTRLRVMEITGLPPSLGNIFIRNFLRLVDYPLAFLIAVISMESSPLNQRLGDRAANTFVIKKSRSHLPAVNLQHTPLASTLSRILAELVDLVFSLGLIYGLLLLIKPNHPLSSALIYLTLPLAFFGYYTLSEFLLETSPGKTLFQRKVVEENGQPPDGTSATLRNLFRPLDYILGYPLLVISKRKQRLGDMAADTLVVTKNVGGKAWWGSLIVLLVVATVIYLGVKNPESSIRKTFGLNPIRTFRSFVPKSLWTISPEKGLKKGMVDKGTKTKDPSKKSKEKLPATTSKTLKLDEFYLATGPQPTQIRHDRIFRQGDLIFLFFKMEGFQLDEKGEAHLTEDLKVEDPDGTLILKKPEIVKISKEVEDPNQDIVFANNIQLPKDAAKGRYRVLITVQDQVADKQFSFEKNFVLR